MDYIIVPTKKMFGMEVKFGKRSSKAWSWPVFVYVGPIIIGEHPGSGEVVVEKQKNSVSRV